MASDRDRYEMGFLRGAAPACDGLEGRVYDMQRGAWVACERCSGTARVVVYVYPKLNRRPR